MSTQPRLRRLAATVLLVWLFALGSGIVNACMVAAQAPHRHAVAQLDADQFAPLDVAEAGGPAHPCDTGETPCQRLCEDVPGAPHGDKQQGTPLTGLWLASAPLPSFHHKVLLPQLSAGVGTGDPGLDVAVPIPIVLLRLAL